MTRKQLWTKWVDAGGLEQNAEILPVLAKYAALMGHSTDVAEFQRKFNIPMPAKPELISEERLQGRTDFMYEELKEFVDAANMADLAGVADALVDLVYVAIGTALQLGLPWEALWADVHQANLRKEPGVTKRNMPYDCVKPEGWVGPRTLEILKEAGYDDKV